MDLQLTDRVYVVTGGARGLGRASAEALVAEGARVVLSGRSQESLDEAAAALNESAGRDVAVGVVADNADRDAPARLLLKAPSIVVLDEATAHLDSESEAAVQQALDAALEGRTSLVIAHRLSTVRNADLILVLDDGRVVQQGTHADLLAAGGLYATLHATQFREEKVELPG